MHKCKVAEKISASVKSPRHNTSAMAGAKSPVPRTRENPEEEEEEEGHVCVPYNRRSFTRTQERERRAKLMRRWRPQGHIHSPPLHSLVHGFLCSSQKKTLWISQSWEPDSSSTLLMDSSSESESELVYK
jgi:hypothetical protein